MVQITSKPHNAPLRLVFSATALLILVLIATNAAVILHLRESELLVEENQLKNLSLTAAEQANRSFQAVDLVATSVAERIVAEGVTDSMSFVQKLAGRDIHLLLGEKISGVPQLSAVSFISNQGKLVNSSRIWPIPEVNVSDRDYFRALKNDSTLNSYISAPVQNRLTGTWTIFLAHRINGASGEFIGLIFGAIEMRYFEDFYQKILLGEAGSIAVQRSDGVLLARFPRTDAIGSALSGSEHLLRGGFSGMSRELSPIDGQTRIKAAHLLPNYPVVVLATKTEQAALANWWSIAHLMSLGALVCVVSIAIAGFALGRHWKQQALLAEAQVVIRRQNDRSAAFDAMTAAKEAAETLTLELLATNTALANTQVALEAALADTRLGEERFRATFEQAAIGFTHVAFDGRFLRVNAQFCEIVGYSQDELMGLTFQALTHPDDRDKSADTARRLQTGEAEACSFEKRYLRKDGAPIWARVTTSVQRDAAGSPLHFVAVVEDIQAHKDAERRKDELEAQLRQSQKLEALGTLAGGVAHDLNNALVPVVGLTEMMIEDASKDGPEREWLGLIQQGAKRARDLAGRILMFARRSEPRREQIEMGEFVAGALGLLRASLPATITIDQQISSVAPVCADHVQLHQVLMNLVTNAAQAIGHQMGTIVVAVRQGALLEGGLPSVRLSVSDTGCGMDEATRLKIFDPFFTTKAVNQGTGLGLSVVHGIVISHGGSILVESKLGQGTRFDVFLPAMDGKAAAQKQEAA